MTSDAKIGLLLGLVFIFVIAFVINGLPSLHPPISKTLANPTVALDETFTTGIAGSADQAVTSITEPLDQPKANAEPAPAKTETPPNSLATRRIISWMMTVLPTPAPPKRPILPPTT